MASSIEKGCTNCRKTDGISVKKCSACGGAYYCSQECQKADWKRHKKDCNYGATDIHFRANRAFKKHKHAILDLATVSGRGVVAYSKKGIIGFHTSHTSLGLKDLEGQKWLERLMSQQVTADTNHEEYNVLICYIEGTEYSIKAISVMVTN